LNGPDSISSIYSCDLRNVIFECHFILLPIFSNILPLTHISCPWTIFWLVVRMILSSIPFGVIVSKCLTSV
jgi:hypothetical protein